MSAVRIVIIQSILLRRLNSVGRRWDLFIVGFLHLSDFRKGEKLAVQKQRVYHALSASTLTARSSRRVANAWQCAVHMIVITDQHENFAAPFACYFPYRKYVLTELEIVKS